jgi:uncharacterized protein
VGKFRLTATDTPRRLPRHAPGSAQWEHAQICLETIFEAAVAVRGAAREDEGMKRWVPTREKIMASRWLGPVAHHLEDDRLWHMERGSVARAVAIGVFFGFLLPTAQFIFAVSCAIWLRGHVAVAAASTLVTNPLTFAPVYWLAHRIGSTLLGRSGPMATEEAAIVEAQTEATIAAEGWLLAALQSVQAAGAPLILGLAVLAVVGAAVGYGIVFLLWRPHHDQLPDPRPSDVTGKP